MLTKKEVKLKASKFLTEQFVDEEMFDGFLSYYYEGRSNEREFEVYEESFEAASFIFKSLLTNKGNKQYMLFSATQAGKTNLMTTFSHIWKDYIRNTVILKSSGKTSLWVFGPSSKALEKQTKKRFSQLDLTVEYVTPSKLGSDSLKLILNEKLYSQRNKKNSIIFMFDEAHENSGLKNNKDGSNEYQNIQDFINDNDIPLMGKQSSNKELEIGIHITATPAHLAEGFKRYSDLYEIVMLKPGKGYKGIHNYLKEEKVFNADYKIDDILKSESAKEFFNKILIRECVEENLDKEKSSYVIIRKAGKNSKKALELLTKDFENVVDIVEYDCDNQNLEDLADDLSNISDNGKTIFVIIKQGLGRGITIHNKEYIQLCYEYRGNAATSIQSLPGRLSGYNVKEHKNIKIYTNMSEMNECIDWLKLFDYDYSKDLTQEKANQILSNLILDNKVRMSGTHCNTNQTSKDLEWYLDLQKSFKTKEEAKSFCLSFNNYYKISISNCSQNKQNIAKGINEKSVMKIAGGQDMGVIDSSIKELRLSMIYLDKPHPDYIEDWKSLDNKLKDNPYVVNVYKSRKIDKNAIKINADFKVK